MTSLYVTKLMIGMLFGNPGRGGIIAASLHPATAFCFGAKSFQEYEDPFKRLKYLRRRHESWLVFIRFMSGF